MPQTSGPVFFAVAGPETYGENSVGAYTVTVQATTVNSAPVAGHIRTGITNEDDAPTVTASLTKTLNEDAVMRINLLKNAQDVDDGAVLSAVVNIATLPQGVTFDAETNELVVDATLDQYHFLNTGDVAENSVEYDVTDEFGASVSQRVNVEIHGQNVEGLNIVGTERRDYLVGTAGDDAIRGFRGNDRAFGGDGYDLIYTGAGSDSLYRGPARMCLSLVQTMGPTKFKISTHPRVTQFTSTSRALIILPISWPWVRIPPKGPFSRWVYPASHWSTSILMTLGPICLHLKPVTRISHKNLSLDFESRAVQICIARFFPVALGLAALGRLVRIGNHAGRWHRIRVWPRRKNNDFVAHRKG